MKISIDVGNGYVKAVSENGDMLHFPTVLKEKNEKSLFNSKANYQIKINDQEYYIGEIALAKKAIRIWKNDRTMNDYTEKFVALCCALLAKDDVNDIDLILGLPYSYYLEQMDSREFTDIFQDKEFDTTYWGEHKRFTIKSVKVYPQGVGAYFLNLFGISGKLKKGAAEFLKSLMIDVGYRTLDVVAFDTINGEFVLIQENSFTLEDCGVINVVNHIVNVLSAEVQLDSDEVERWLRNGNGTIQYDGGDFDVSAYENEAYEELANRIFTAINTKLQGDIKKYKNIFITGGGAEKLYAVLQKKYKNLMLQDDYVYCNAKGYLAIEQAS